MDKFSENILKVNTVICSNIAKKEILSDDGLLAQNVLAQLRNFAEALILKIYSVNHDADFSHEVTKKALKYVKSQDDLVFLQRFHRRLEVTDSHRTVELDAALRLMDRYYDSLIESKEYIKKHFDLEVLANIEDFPLEQDENLKEYYLKISREIEKRHTVVITESPTNRFYIKKKKLFRVKGERYYEITMTVADIHSSKFDRIIAFTKLNIPMDYAVHLRLTDAKIDILNREMAFKIIVGYQVSIRPCEFDNYFRLLGHTTKIETKGKEYLAWMSYLTETRRNLTDFLELDEEDFVKIKDKILRGIQKTPIFNGLQLCRSYYGKSGYNILTYLLYGLNNLMLTAQYYRNQNNRLSYLYLSNGCIPFDRMPFANNPLKYNANLHDVYACISVINREHELLARKIKTNTEVDAQLYTPIGELKDFKQIDVLINRYNSNLYDKHKPNSSLKCENGQIFIAGYEKNSVDIIQTLLSLTKECVEGYTASVEEWIKKSDYPIDDDRKWKRCGIYSRLRKSV